MTGESLRTGWRFKVLGLLIGCGVLATSGADVAVASARHAAHVRQQRHRALVAEEQSYLRQLRSLAADVGREVVPVQRVLSALSSPRPGDIWAARDALSTSDSYDALRQLLSRAKALRAPAPWARPGSAVAKSISEFADALAEMRRQQHVEDPETLNGDLLGTDLGKLMAAEDDWSRALSHLFARARQKSPRTPYPGIRMQVPAVAVSWAFAADRACVAANLADAPLVDRILRTPGDSFDLHRAAAIEHRMTATIRQLALPRRDVTRFRAVLFGLRTLDAEASALDRVATAIERHDAVNGPLAADQLRTTTAALKPLGRTFRTVGLSACAGFVGDGTPRSRKHAVTT